MAQIGRLLTAMVTPFTPEGAVDYAQAGRLALALLESGSDGVVVSGTTGEAPTLTTEEKLRLFAEVKRAVGSAGTVIAGTSSYNTAESVELTQEAERHRPCHRPALHPLQHSRSHLGEHRRGDYRPPVAHP
jgi:4-hydroxy-tetrahydrodipicolinate synthase